MKAILTLKNCKGMCETITLACACRHHKKLRNCLATSKVCPSQMIFFRLTSDTGNIKQHHSALNLT